MQCHMTANCLYLRSVLWWCALSCTSTKQNKVFTLCLCVCACVCVSLSLSPCKPRRVLSSTDLHHTYSFVRMPHACCALSNNNRGGVPRSRLHFIDLSHIRSMKCIRAREREREREAHTSTLCHVKVSVIWVPDSLLHQSRDTEVGRLFRVVVGCETMAHARPPNSNQQQAIDRIVAYKTRLASIVQH